MKKIGLTQRVTLIEKYQERRDSLDQRWFTLLSALEFVPVPLPNLIGKNAGSYAQDLGLSAIILTGGDIIGDTPERDVFELALIEWAINANCPIVGVCRGMQMINYYFGGSLSMIDQHVAVTHLVQFAGQWHEKPARTVNSYHQWGIFPDDLAKELKPTAHHADGSIEAFVYPNKKISGIMWHPERESPLVTADVALLKELL